MNKHVTELFEINGKAIGMTVVNFGKSLFVWVGSEGVKFDSLFVSFPYKNNNKYSNDFVTTSLLGENEFGYSISSYICKLHNVSVSLSMNIEEELDNTEMKRLQVLMNKKISEVLGK
ncbi:hypothetical protein FG386_001948 [Cryptosporidium ryanae]|uniref:uncharacterized protein n=1 Tax=Cryptosporidium ryanae TaxID=515981 RepID=UPI00351A89A3|nr:hypothetical protein FG386_001948 [Cryptosporidium ryanae]